MSAAHCLNLVEDYIFNKIIYLRYVNEITCDFTPLVRVHVLSRILSHNNTSIDTKINKFHMV